jgi:hypothetical protein
MVDRKSPVCFLGDSLPFAAPADGCIQSAVRFSSDMLRAHTFQARDCLPHDRGTRLGQLLKVNPQA